MRAQVEGWLLKKGDKGLVKGYKKRWFSLQNNRLYYYQNASDPQPLGYIDIVAASAIMPACPPPSSTSAATKVAPSCCSPFPSTHQCLSLARVYVCVFLR